MFTTLGELHIKFTYNVFSLTHVWDCYGKVLFMECRSSPHILNARPYNHSSMEVIQFIPTFFKPPFQDIG